MIFDYKDLIFISYVGSLCSNCVLVIKLDTLKSNKMKRVRVKHQILGNFVHFMEIEYFTSFQFLTTICIERILTCRHFSHVSSDMRKVRKLPRATFCGEKFP